MCSYCGCRSIKPIADLSAEHVDIQNLCGEVRRAAMSENIELAGERLVRLAAVLREHDAVEELSIYPAMARHTEYSDKVGNLFDEHDDVNLVIEQALATMQQRGAAQVDWATVIAEFETLIEHIQHEENGLFPAAAIALETKDWEAADHVRGEYRKTTSQPFSS